MPNFDPCNGSGIAALTLFLFFYCQVGGDGFGEVAVTTLCLERRFPNSLLTHWKMATIHEQLSTCITTKLEDWYGYKEYISIL